MSVNDSLHCGLELGLHVLPLGIVEEIWFFLIVVVIVWGVCFVGSRDGG